MTCLNKKNCLCKTKTTVVKQAAAGVETLVDKCQRCKKESNKRIES